MNKQQYDSAIRTVLKIVGTVLLTHGSTKAAAIVNSEDVIGLCITIVGVVMSQWYHSESSQLTHIETKLEDHGSADIPLVSPPTQVQPAQPKKDPTV